MICQWVHHSNAKDLEAAGWAAFLIPGHHERYGVLMCKEEDVDSITHAHEICAQAADIISGDREETHGAKERSFETIARFWNIYLNGKAGPLRPSDVASMMALLKIARSLHGRYNPDDFVDLAGYAGIAGELASIDEAQPGETVVPMQQGANAQAQ